MSKEINTHMQTKGGECAHHGHFTAMFLNVNGGFWTSCPLCVQSEITRQARQQEKSSEEERAYNRSMLFLQQAGMPKRFLGESFGSFETGYSHAVEQQKAFTACLSFAERVCHGSSGGEVLSLYGSTGTGKTHLACSIIRNVAFSGTYRQCLYATASSIVGRSGNVGNGIHSLFDLFSVDLLVIDDVDGHASSLAPLIERRRTDHLPTVMVFNAEDRIEPYDDGNVSEVRFFWPSHRKARRGVDGK